jgi:hypothetical protein
MMHVQMQQEAQQQQQQQQQVTKHQQSLRCPRGLNRLRWLQWLPVLLIPTAACFGSQTLLPLLPSVLPPVCALPLCLHCCVCVAAAVVCCAAAVLR